MNVLHYRMRNTILNYQENYLFSVHLYDLFEVDFLDWEEMLVLLIGVWNNKLF